MSHWDVVKINRMYKCGGGGGGGHGHGGPSPFFGFGGFDGHPGGNSVDDEISFDGNDVSEGADDDDSVNEVFSSIANDPAFEGLFSGSSERGSNPRAQQITRPSGGPFPRSAAPPPPPPGLRGLPSPLLSGPPLSGPDYDDTPKGGAVKVSHGSPGQSFPDNPFANIPSNPFAPRSGLPSNGVDDAPAEYYDTQQDISKDYYNY